MKFSIPGPPSERLPCSTSQYFNVFLGNEERKRCCHGRFLMLSVPILVIEVISSANFFSTCGRSNIAHSEDNHSSRSSDGVLSTNTNFTSSVDLYSRYLILISTLRVFSFRLQSTQLSGRRRRRQVTSDSKLRLDLQNTFSRQTQRTDSQ